MLGGIGDADAGEWWERGEIATHLRRRLTDLEAVGIGPVCDVRGTDEARRRAAAMIPFLPEQVREWAHREALGGSNG